MPVQSIDEIIETFRLRPHPEGGFFKRIYTSALVADAEVLGQYPSSRNLSSAILYLLPAGTFSALHSIKQDETWHFHSGSPLEITEIHADSRSTKTLLGHKYEQDEKPVHTVFGNTWFMAKPISKIGYSFVSCLPQLCRSSFL